MVKKAFFFFAVFFFAISSAQAELAERVLRRYLVSRSEEAGVGAWDVFERQRDQSLQFLTSLGETKYQRFVERYVAARSGETPEEVQARLQNQPIYKSDLVDFAPVGVEELKDDPMIMRVTLGAKGELNQVRLFDSEQNKIVMDFTTELSIEDRDKVQLGQQPRMMMPREERLIRKRLIAEELELLAAREREPTEPEVPPPGEELCRDPADPTCQVPGEICADPADPACRRVPSEICADPADPACRPEACRDHWSIRSTRVAENCLDPITIYETNCLGEERVTKLPPFFIDDCPPPVIINGKKCGKTIDQFDNARVYALEGVTAVNGGDGETYVSPSESCRDDHFIVGKISRIQIPKDGWVDIGRDYWRDGFRRTRTGVGWDGQLTGSGQSPCIFFDFTQTMTETSSVLGTVNPHEGINPRTLLLFPTYLLPGPPFSTSGTFEVGIVVIKVDDEIVGETVGAHRRDSVRGGLTVTVTSAQAAIDFLRNQGGVFVSPAEEQNIREAFDAAVREGITGLAVLNGGVPIVKSFTTERTRRFKLFPRGLIELMNGANSTDSVNGADRIRIRFGLGHTAQQREEINSIKEKITSLRRERESLIKALPDNDELDAAIGNINKQIKDCKSQLKDVKGGSN